MGTMGNTRRVDGSNDIGFGGITDIYDLKSAVVVSHICIGAGNINA